MFSRYAPCIHKIGKRARMKMLLRHPIPSLSSMVLADLSGCCNSSKKLPSLMAGDMRMLSALTFS
jgi:hypothetical protein